MVIDQRCAYCGGPHPTIRNCPHAAQQTKSPAEQKCRWPACEDDTDCMNGCKPAPAEQMDVREALARKLDGRLNRDRRGDYDMELGLKIDGNLYSQIADAVKFLRSPAVSAGGEPVAWQATDEDLVKDRSITIDAGVAEIWRKAGMTVRPLYAANPPGDVRDSATLVLTESQQATLDFERALASPEDAAATTVGAPGAKPMSITRDDKIKCDECGKFVSTQDLIDGKALHHCVLPDSLYSDETFESLCGKCYAPVLQRSPQENSDV